MWEERASVRSVKKTEDDASVNSESKLFQYDANSLALSYLSPKLLLLAA